MGDKKVSMDTDDSRMRQFTKAVLNDLQALEKMLADRQLEDGVFRIGAEQEMFLVDMAMHPAPVGIGCLPIIRAERFVGLIIAYDFLTVSAFFKVSPYERY